MEILSRFLSCFCSVVPGSLVVRSLFLAAFSSCGLNRPVREQHAPRAPQRAHREGPTASWAITTDSVMGRGAPAGSLGAAAARWTETSSQRENDIRPLRKAGAEHSRMFGCRGVKQLPGGVGHSAGLKPCLLLQVRGTFIPNAEGGTSTRDDNVNFLKGHEAALLDKPA